MIKILFVCHGNICRSTMAEFVLKDLVNRRGVAHRYLIASAATSDEEIGNPVHRGTREKLAQHGIACDGKRAVQMTRSDYDRYDLILGMDGANLRNMRRIMRSDPDGKLGLLLDGTDDPRDIADPWYTGDFDATWRDVTAGCEALLNRLEAENGAANHSPVCFKGAQMGI